MSHPVATHDPENELPEDIERDQEDYLREKEELKSPFANQAEEDLEVEAIEQYDNETH